ncbi:MAG: tetratricopeptide repeat protein [bacterium]|nr:tetratricopeptide repeat protein [bacterium]
MALSRHKKLQSAERLLKQGKVQAALGELERLAGSAPSDLLTLNRMGDLLARQGRKSEAAGYYQQVAAQFTRQGFYPKAVAIRKKVLRLDAKNCESLLQLGDLYVKQNLPGEARKYFLRAADEFVQIKDFSQARDVYERLVSLEPNDVRHKARLAEARAAEGDRERGGEELLELAHTLLASGKPEDAERTYRRAGELLDARPEPLVGVANCLTESGQEGQALTMLQEVMEQRPGDAVLLGEVVLRLERGGRFDEAMTLLSGENGERVPRALFERVLSWHLEQGTDGEFWDRFDPVLDSWCEKGRAARGAEILSALGNAEDDGHTPALRRGVELCRASGDTSGQARLLERLVSAWVARSMHKEASAALDQLRAIEPQSPMLEGAGGGAPTLDAASLPSVEDDGDTTPELPEDAETPAVPLGPNDEEFVTGRLTQAEILEKYGLKDQALEQIREAVDRFPGHLKAQERRVALLRGSNNQSDLRAALIGVALAMRASGESEQALPLVLEANRLKPFRQASAQDLERLAILPDDLRSLLAVRRAGPAADMATEVAVEMPVDVPVVEIPEMPAPAPAPAPVAEIPTAAATPPTAPNVPESKPGEMVLIDFDAMEGGEEAEEAEELPVEALAPPEAVVEAPPAVSVAPPAPAPAALSVPEVAASAATTGAREPAEEMLGEIRHYLDAGFVDDARRKVDALRTLGYGGDALGVLEQALDSAGGVDAEPVAAPDDAAIDIFDDDDLTSITAALENELFADADEAPAPESESEESLEDVFAAFKQQVEEEVDSDDYRTHYDLGIAYKEMGLIDEAIAEFQTSIKAPELLRDGCTMLAMCHRDRNELSDAVEWYRKAVEAPGRDPDALSGLRYDLAETLLLAGDQDAALDVFRDVLADNPAFRDVQTRVADLEGAVRA